MMKELKEELTKLLSIIYQQSWFCGEVPDDWKLVNVRPIHKKGCKKDPGNSRPVILTSVPGEVLHPSEQLGGQPLDSLQQADIPPVLGTPKLGAAPQMGSHQRRSRGAESPHLIYCPGYVEMHGTMRMGLTGAHSQADSGIVCSAHDLEDMTKDVHKEVVTACEKSC
ncbi:hypothetical protein BTVI_07563 [Pitangus sulphuratus]|nr:hypothetical protein BTVI_07563 [Pitangus sulphuratus]